MQDNSNSFSNIYNRIAICIRLTNILYSAEHILVTHRILIQWRQKIGRQRKMMKDEKGLKE